jgi:hypothetical protein
VSPQLLSRVDELTGVYRSFIPRLPRTIAVSAPATAHRWWHPARPIDCRRWTPSASTVRRL